MRPVVVIDEFVFRQTPLIELFPHVVRHARIVGQKVHQALLVDLVFLQNFPPALVRTFGIVVVEADVVGAERAVVVGVGLAIGDRIELLKSFTPAGVQDSEQQFVLSGVVSLGFRKGNAISCVIRQAHAKAVGLDAFVAFTVVPRAGQG